MNANWTILWSNWNFYYFSVVARYRYLTYTEWSQYYGGKKLENSENEHIKFKRLPYDCCSITMIPFETPYSDLDGNVFELEAIIDFLKTFKVNPITGKTCDSKSLIKLNFHRNADGNYHCPSLFKPFTKNSHIVAIAPTGNVFCYEAVEQLNIKTKNWKDLVDDTPFTRKDIITIQDPNNIEKFNISTFYHIRKQLRVETEEEKLERKDPQGRLKTVSAETKDILNELERDFKPSAKPDDDDQAGSSKKFADKFNSAHYSTGAVAASFTSTAMQPVYNHEAAILDDHVVRYERVKKKGYVRLNTNLGPLNIELYCDLVPRTCENFIRHCDNGYYDGTIFHRSIKNFMVSSISWLEFGCFWDFRVNLDLFLFFFRFKGVIQRKLDVAANPFGTTNSKTKFFRNCHIRAVAYCLWQIPDQTQTVLNCM